MSPWHGTQVIRLGGGLLCVLCPLTGPTLAVSDDSEIMWHLHFCSRLTSLNTILSRSMYVVSYVSISLSFTAGRYSTVYTHQTLSIHLVMNWDVSIPWLSLVLPGQAKENSHFPEWFHTFEFIPGTEAPGSLGAPLWSFEGILCCFQNGYINLHSFQWVKMVFFSSHSLIVFCHIGNSHSS